MSVPGADEGLSVRVTGLVKTFSPGGQVLRAVDGVDLDVAAGEFVALTGPSGSGKSTLLHLIGALDRPDAGTITVGSINVTALQRRRLPGYRRRVGFVFQRYHLLPALTALDNVLAPALPRRPGREQQALARDLLGRWAWAVGRTPCRPGCTAASSNAWPSHGHCSSGPVCYWPTNRPATSTSTPDSKCSRSWPDYGPNAGPRSCSSPTTRAWPRGRPGCASRRRQGRGAASPRLDPGRGRWRLRGSAPAAPSCTHR